MSASIPSSNGKTREEKGRSFLWLLFSILAHAIVIGWLVYLVKPKELFVSETGEVRSSELPVAVSPERLQEIAEQIEQTQAEEIKIKVEELIATQQSLADLTTEQQAEFSKLEEEFASEAPEKVVGTSNAVSEAQAAAEKALTEALKAAEELKQAVDAANAAPPEGKGAADAAVQQARDITRSAQEKAKNAQAHATSTQNAAVQQLGFLTGPAKEEARKAQEAAAAAQAEANHQQDEAIRARVAIEDLARDLKRANDGVENAQRNVQRTEERLAAQQGKITQLENDLNARKEKLKGLEAAGTADPNNAREIRRANDEIGGAQRRLDSARQDEQRIQRDIEQKKREAEPAIANAGKIKQSSQNAPETLRVQQDEALKAQQHARSAQEAAHGAIAKAAGMEPPRAGPTEMPQLPAFTAPSLEGQSLSELYQTAVNTETAIAAQFQAVRATQVAMQRQIPLAVAMKYVEIARPVRGAFPAEAQVDVHDPKSLEAQNAAIGKTIQEIDSMLALSRSMASQARSGGAHGSQGVTLTAAAMKMQAAQNDLLTALATETEGQNAVDLVELMKQIASGKFPGPESEGHGNGSGTGIGPAAGGAGAPGRGRGPGSGAAPLMENVANSLPGRKIHGGGDGVLADKWMYVDSWYIIGPFPNPQRRNLDTKFPPESVVDLDAAYPSEAGPGGVVRWEYVQNLQAGVRPPHERDYAIYYAYTTLWADEDRDVWIAMGSDDYSKLYINDMLVWASGTQHKAWNPSEGYRKVHLRKGVNRMLMRVENGQHMCMFSLMVALNTPK